jgi:hypothetical protein
MKLKTLATLGATLLAASASAQVLVAPGGLASTEGDSNNAYPFNIGAIGITSQRYQQIYNSSLFSILPSGGVLITGIAFRVSNNSGDPFSAALPDIQLDLSTTSANENSLSTTFASNVGANDTVVYARGSMQLSGTDNNTSIPNPFDVVIQLTTPFIYNPAAGNLLLDVRNYGGGLTTQFDATSVSGDGMARVSSEFTGNVNSSAGTVSDTLGMVTEFIFQPVPEPSTFALAGLAGLGLLKFRRR